MSLSSVLAPEFSKTTRGRGAEYAHSLRVTLQLRTADSYDALVRGTEHYAVRLRISPDADTIRVFGSCTCPYALDEIQPCKHMWATILVAEREGWPDVGHPLTPEHTSFELIDPGEPEEVDLVDVVGGGATSGRRPTSPSKSRQFLDYLDGQLIRRDDEHRMLARIPDELIYVIDADASRLQQGVVVHLMGRQRKRSGEWSRPKPIKPATMPLRQISEIDRSIIGSLVGAAKASTPASWFDPHDLGAQSPAFLLSEVLTPDLLPVIARTGRAYLRRTMQVPDLQPLAWDEGEPWHFRVDVNVSNTGFVVSGAFHRPGDSLDLGAPALAVGAGFLVTDTAVARLEQVENAALMMSLRANGPVDVARGDAGRLAHALARAGIPGAELPDELRVHEVDVAPVPRLTVTATRWGSANQFDATTTFDYEGTIVADDGVAVTFDEARRRVVRRRVARERELVARLFHAGFQSAYDYGGQPAVRIATKRLLPAVHLLLAEGWHVEGHGHAYRRASSVALSVSSGVDWFDLQATVDFGGAHAPVADLLEALNRRETTVRLGDGSVGILPEDWIARYAPLAAAAEIKDGHFRFHRSQAALLDALLEARNHDTSVSVDDEFGRVRRELEAFAEVEPMPEPPGFQGTLRDYQREGLGWFHFLRRFGFGGCLADDMGLGKTIMVLALLAWRQHERQADPSAPRSSLIVVPRSLVHNWMAEAARFAPGLAVLDYSGAGRSASRATLGEYDVVLTTYGTLRRDVVDLRDVEFEYVILDEAQAIKNAGTASAKAARLLAGRHRLALSGTPIENHLGELWSLIEFLNPGLLGRATVFQRAATGSHVDADTLALMSRALRPFILRRTKAQVARELPARTEQTLLCDLSKHEREVYDSLRRHFRDTLLARVDRVGMARSKIQVLEALLRLRQAACHLGLVDIGFGGDSSAKFDLLLPRLRELAEEGHKALVFSQFTTLLGLLRRRLDADGLVYEYLDGKTRDRQARVDRFQRDPACPLFLISLRAGGVGLNLTAGEYVFLLDPWWNPAVEAQAIDRTHRIGQTREVFAYRVIAADTVEEKVLELQNSKRALADAVLRADAGGLRNLQREDLELLLS